MRNCACMKRFLRLTGQDAFDDFELMCLVHEALFESAKGKLTTIVQITAGVHTVKTDPNSNAVFQQPLHITIEQGTETIKIDLLDSSEHILAELTLDVVKDVLHDTMPEHVRAMKKRDGAGIINPRIKLTMVVSMDEDEEKGLMAGVGNSSDTDLLVRQQLKKAKQESAQRMSLSGDHEVTELDVLKQACSGPLEMFEGLGKTASVYAAVVGPPSSRRWVLGVWKDEKAFQDKQRGIMEIDLLKVQSVQADPARHHVFVINCYDESRVRRSMTFRRIDRARDVWVQMLHLLVVKARETGKVRSKTARGGPGGGNKSSGSDASPSHSRGFSRSNSVPR